MVFLNRLIGTWPLWGMAATLVAFYPGFFTLDSYKQLSQARAGSYGDWHPPLMAAMWRQLDAIAPGPFGMLLLQLGLIWAGLWLIGRSLRAAGHRPLSIAVFGALVVFFPPVFGILGMIWKDVQMAGWLLFGFGLASVLLYGGLADRGRQALLAAGVLLCAVVVMMLRINGIGAAFGLVWLTVWAMLGQDWAAKWRRIGVSGIAAVATTLILSFVAILASRQLTDVREHSWTSVAIFDVVGTAVAADSLDHLDQDALDRLALPMTGTKFSVADWRAAYDPRTWIATKSGEMRLYEWTGPQTFTARQMTALRELWTESIAAHPIPYLQHRWRSFREVIGLSEAPLWSPTLFGYPMAEYDAALGLETRLSEAQKALQWRLNAVARGTGLFHPYFYLPLAALLLIVGLVGMPRLTPLIVGLAASALAHEATLFIAAPSADFRYSHWMILATWIAVLLTVWRTALPRFAAACFRGTRTPAPDLD